jgi:hypothetical protein
MKGYCVLGVSSGVIFYQELPKRRHKEEIELKY